MRERKRYTKEFKQDAVSLVNDQGYTRIEAARSLGINANMLGRWVKEFNRDDGQAFRGNGKLTPDQEEIRKLKAQVKRLEMEKDILKKATVDSIGHSNTEYLIVNSGDLCYGQNWKTRTKRWREGRNMGTLAQG